MPPTRSGAARPIPTQCGPIERCYLPRQPLSPGVRPGIGWLVSPSVDRFRSDEVICGPPIAPRLLWLWYSDGWDWTSATGRTPGGISATEGRFGVTLAVWGHPGVTASISLPP